MKCTTCLVNTAPYPYPECTLCNHMRSGMPVDDFKANCQRICTLQILRQYDEDDAIKIARSMPRPVTHPLCKYNKNKCVAANPSWRRFKFRMKEKGGELSRKEWEVFKSMPCDYCAKKPANGLDRLNSSSTYTIANVVPCCMLCNIMKREESSDIFINHACKVAYQN